ncbi:hypothetical protein PVAND_000925 [Polypedilum vanderplanki]|uniref:BTB domain-containing protein n=1 Tax=Polypedilum vanderplanki TaxID=319348 RepID=A0A9J6BLP4_POLVA|nr:hypothetical protein PVAND_000925 [Polypedilum vanderplanki]
MQQVIDCEYYYGNWTLSQGAYSVHIDDQIISDDKIHEYRVIHDDGMINKNVRGINFRNCTISRVPQGLTKIFPNAKFLQLSYCKLKSLKREDLKEYSKFTDLTIIFNEIPFIPGDLLADMKDLIGVWLHDNKIQIIEPNLLDGLINLKACDLSNNLCIDMKYDDLEEDKGNSTFGELRTEIRKVYENSPWRKIHLENKTLKAENEILKQNLKSEIGNDLEEIIKVDDFKDFTILVKGEKFKAHKLVLAARSQTFAEMLKKNLQIECLNLVDISSKIFREILNFIYTNEFPKSNEIDFIQLFIASRRLKIEKLIHFAADKLIDEISPENALEILKMSNKYGNEKLQKKSFDEIKKILNNIKISDDLIKDTEKLQKMLEVKIKQNKIMEVLNEEMSKLLKE